MLILSLIGVFVTLMFYDGSTWIRMMFWLMVANGLVALLRLVIPLFAKRKMRE